MKKIFKVCLVLIFMFSTLAMINVSAATYATEGRVKQYVTEMKDTVEITIALQGSTAYINGISLYIPYDSTKLVYNADTSNVITNDMLSTWATKSITAAYSSYDGTNYIKINYASTNFSGNDWVKVNENQEVILFSFQLQKLNANQRIGSACPTTWVAVKTTPFAYAYSTITTANNSANYSVKSDANPQQFTIVYTQCEDTITASISTRGRVTIDGVIIADGSVTSVADGTATIYIDPLPNNIVESATFDGVDMGISKFGGTYNAVFTGEKALVVKFRLVNNIKPIITGDGIVLLNNTIINDDGITDIDFTVGYDVGRVILKILPAFGYQVSSATLDGVNMGIPADGGFYEAVIYGQESLIINFSVKEYDREIPQMYKHVFAQNDILGSNIPQGKNVATLFIKMMFNGIPITEQGVKLTDSDGNDIKISSGEGPYFESQTDSSASGQYGIQFIALPKLADGKTYIATPYVKRGETMIFGAPVTFTVE